MEDRTIVDFEKVKTEKRIKEALGDQYESLVEYEKSKISIEEYTRGVRTLVDFVLRNPTTGSATICASVLLSCYDGAEFHVNLSSLGILDLNLYPATLAVIRGRVERGKGPHELIEDGSTVFFALREQYQLLTVKNRANR